MTASMTTIDLILKPRTELLEPVTKLFKLAAPSISSCALSIYFSQFLTLLLFSSYPLPTLTMDHIPLSKCDGLCERLFTRLTYIICDGVLGFVRADPTQIIAHAHWSQ